MSDKIRIGIAEDHKMFSKTLTDFLNNENDIQVLFNAENGAQLLDQLEINPVDIILLDLDMPIMDGREALHIIRKKFDKELKIIILSWHDEELTIRKYMKAGANAYLVKDDDPNALIEGIREVYESGVYFHDKVSPQLVEELMNDDDLVFKAIKDDPLSKTEIEVLKLLCQGKTSEEIAQLWNRSTKTINNHRFRISKKLDIHNHMLLMEYAIIHGIHEPNV